MLYLFITIGLVLLATLGAAFAAHTRWVVGRHTRRGCVPRCPRCLGWVLRTRLCGVGYRVHGIGSL